MEAYDYTRQTWVSGPAAVRIRKAQAREELTLLTGPDGARYAQFIGLTADQARSKVFSLTQEV